jgi:hypothetical protein
VKRYGSPCQTGFFGNYRSGCNEPRTNPSANHKRITSAITRSHATMSDPTNSLNPPNPVETSVLDACQRGNSPKRSIG